MLTVPIIKTARLRLEPLAMCHSEGMFEMWRQPEVQEFSGPAQDEHGQPIQLPASSATDSDRLIQFWLKAASDGWGFRWAIMLRSSQEFIGHVGFNSLHECSEIAYHLNPNYWGEGYMFEATEAAIAWRKEGGAKVIEAFIEPENSDSIKLALRLGMIGNEIEVNGTRRYMREV